MYWQMQARQQILTCTYRQTIDYVDLEKRTSVMQLQYCGLCHIRFVESQAVALENSAIK